MPRKKRIAIMVVIIILVISIISGVIFFLYQTTDLFKSNTELFLKYLSQNEQSISSLVTNLEGNVSNTIKQSKYTSELEGKIEHIQDINTTDENTRNTVNKANLKIDSVVDVNNNYNYKNVKLMQNEDEITHFEYIEDSDLYGVRLTEINQFVSADNSSEGQVEEFINVDNFTNILKILNLNIGDIENLITFTDEEKMLILETYKNIILDNVAKDSFGKQKNALITIQNQEITANAYYIKVTKEQYNNLVIKILEQIKQDDIILQKIENIMIFLKEYTKDQQYDISKDDIKQKIDKKIEDIKNNNIGQEEVRITVYENNRTTVRTSIETPEYKIILDTLKNENNIYIQFTNTKLGTSENSDTLKIQRVFSENEENLKAEYIKIENNNTTKNSNFEYLKKLEGQKATNSFSMKIENEKTQTKLSINEDIEIVNELENQIKLNNQNNVIINNLSLQQQNEIKQIIQDNINAQGQKILSVVSWDDFIQLLKDIKLIKNTITFSDENNVTEAEKNRFNTQFEFYIGEEMKAENIQNLLNIVEANLEDVEVVSNTRLKLKIKKDTKNDEWFNKVKDFITENDGETYAVAVEYDENTQLVNAIVIDIKEKD